MFASTKGFSSSGYRMMSVTTDPGCHGNKI